MDFQPYKTTLEHAGVVFAPGLSNHEIHQIEASYAFRFPADYRAFLMFALPISHGFVDWRHGDRAHIHQQLAWPYEGICFDIEHNNFWLRAWGPRPADLTAAFAIAHQAVAEAPTLIPVAGHRYIPDVPADAGNPIFSVYQTDIIYYGRDLLEYLENEFGYYFFGQSRYQITEPIRSIAFWSHLVAINDGQIEDGSA
jgi:hypothetical protein